MAVSSQQIGWSQKDKLLWNISKQLEILTQVTSKVVLSPSSTSTTTTLVPITTTTTTTSGPIVYSFPGKWSYMDRQETCIGFNDATYYSTLPEMMIGDGAQIFTDLSLTTTPPQPYIAITNISYSNSGGFLSGGLPCATPTTTSTTTIAGIVTDELILNLDAANPSSYPGTGTTWTDLSGNGYNNELIGSPTFVQSGNQSYFNLTGSNYMQGNSSMSGNNANQISGDIGLTVCMVVTINDASARSILFGHYQPFAPAGYVFEAGTLNGLWTNTLRTYMAGASGQGVDARGDANTITTGGSYILQWVFDYPTKTTTLYINDTAIGYVQSGYPSGLANNWNNNVLYNIGYDGEGNYSQIKVYGCYVYRTPLNSTQIAQNYNALVAKIAPTTTTTTTVAPGDNFIATETNDELITESGNNLIINYPLPTSEIITEDGNFVITENGDNLTTQ